MMSTIFFGFFYPLPSCPHLKLMYTIEFTQPHLLSPLFCDPLRCRHDIWMPPDWGHCWETLHLWEGNHCWTLSIHPFISPPSFLIHHAKKRENTCTLLYTYQLYLPPIMNTHLGSWITGSWRLWVHVHSQVEPDSDVFYFYSSLCCQPSFLLRCVRESANAKGKACLPDMTVNYSVSWIFYWGILYSIHAHGNAMSLWMQGGNYMMHSP